MRDDVWINALWETVFWRQRDAAAHWQLCRFTHDDRFTGSKDGQHLKKANKAVWKRSMYTLTIPWIG